MKKRILSFLITICTLFAITCTVYAGSHSGTYDMTGGIFYKKAFKAKKNITIEVTPKQGTWNCDMGIYTAKKGLFGYSGADFIADVSSKYYSKTTYKTKKAIDGIYFRDWAGQRWTGSFKVSW